MIDFVFLKGERVWHWNRGAGTYVARDDWDRDTSHVAFEWGDQESDRITHTDLVPISQAPPKGRRRPRDTTCRLCRGQFDTVADVEAHRPCPAGS